MIPETQVWQLMSKPVRRLSMNARLRDAADFLRRWAISGAPVVDVHGRPVGVFSLRDLAAHFTDRLQDLPVVDADSETARKTGEKIPIEEGFHFEGLDDSRVSDYMTPMILCVDPDAPIIEAIRQMQRHAIHRIFVRRRRGPLLGVVTTMDILRWIGSGGVEAKAKPESRKKRVS